MTDWLDPVRGNETIGRIAFIPDDFENGFLKPEAVQIDHIREGLSVQRVDCSRHDEVSEICKLLGRKKSQNSQPVLMCASADQARAVSLEGDPPVLSVKADPTLTNQGHAIIQPNAPLKRSQLGGIRMKIIEFLSKTIEITVLQ